MIRQLFFISATLLTTVLSVANASTLESREAWLSASAFDGQNFKYQYVVYDAQNIVKDDVKISCDYTQNSGAMILKSVEVKIMIQAQFDQPGAQTKRSGSVDVSKAVSDCQKVLPGGRNAMRSPVAIKLPMISVPSQD
jgi:hypothetical protein